MGNGMNSDECYPHRVEDVLDPTMTFDPKVVTSVKRFSRSRPWRGTVAERQKKFRKLHVELAKALSVNPPILIFSRSAHGDTRESCYILSQDTIILVGLSVVTFLHEWGHRLHGRSEREACRWSINLFRECFPRSFARCRFEGHMLRRGRHDDP